MLNSARDEFLRRYATSPIDVPRLERLLAVYGSGEDDDAFCSRFIGWDRACTDPDAARIVTETSSRLATPPAGSRASARTPCGPPFDG